MRELPIIFQSTLPVWGATAFEAVALSDAAISIHAPRVGSDSQTSFGLTCIFNFNPRSPCGERRVKVPSVPLLKHFNPRSPCGERRCICSPFPPTVYFNPRSPCGERPHPCRRSDGLCGFQSTLPVWGATAKMHRFFFCIFGKKGIFCDILQIGRHLQGIGRKRRGDFLSRSVRTSRGKYGYLAFAFRESGGLRENRRFYSQSVLFSFRIDCQGSRIAGCPFRGP